MRLDRPKVAASRLGTKGGTQFERHFPTVLIREIPTGRYWDRHGFWTSDLGKATSFRDCRAALEEVKHWQLSLVHLVMTRELGTREVVPLKARVRA